MAAAGAFATYAYALEHLPQWFGIWTNLSVGIAILVGAGVVRLAFITPFLIGGATIFIIDGIFNVWDAHGGGV